MNPNSDGLAHVPIFARLSEPKRIAVARAAILRKYHMNDLLALAGDIWPYLFFLEIGKINALKTSIDGRSLLVESFGPGDIFWGLAFFQEDKTLPVTLQAVQKCRVLLWTRDRLLPFFLEFPQILWELCGLMAIRMQRAGELVQEHAFQPISCRLARLLLDSFETTGASPVARYMTLDEMAVRIGTTREVVCRTLYQFSDRKLIEVTRTEFSLINKEGLAKLGYPD